VWCRKNNRWLWTVMCRRTRQIVAFANVDHSESPCRALWERVPEAYRKCRSFSDFWKTYAVVLPGKTHRSVGNETWQTAQMGLWNNTQCQRVGRFVHETLSFSKKDWWHDRVAHWFIVEYNLSCSW
jgi:IS1 family transposase